MYCHPSNYTRFTIYTITIVNHNHPSCYLVSGWANHLSVNNADQSPCKDTAKWLLTLRDVEAISSHRSGVHPAQLYTQTVSLIQIRYINEKGEVGGPQKTTAKMMEWGSKRAE
jgi:hypothetical protein